MGRPPPWWSIRHSTVHPDWYWVRQVKDAKDITHEIRRKTAGLGQAWACAHPQARWAQSHNARKEGREFEFTYPWYKNADYDLETWEEVRESIDPNRFPCIDRFCNHSARCYNNLGFEKVSFREIYVLMFSGWKRMQRRSTLRTMPAKSSDSVKDPQDSATMEQRVM